jgi:hypothetical protein
MAKTSTTKKQQNQAGQGTPPQPPQQETKTATPLPGEHQIVEAMRTNARHSTNVQDLMAGLVPQIISFTHAVRRELTVKEDDTASNPKEAREEAARARAHYSEIKESHKKSLLSQIDILKGELAGLEKSLDRL